jgi:TetR/AcrR family acrAB operon transcriptional repressor
MEECQASLFERFSKAHDMGLIRSNISPTLATDLLQAVLGGLFHDWLRNPDQFSIRERGETLVNSLLLMMRRQDSM